MSLSLSQGLAEMWQYYYVLHLTVLKLKCIEEFSYSCEPVGESIQYSVQFTVYTVQCTPVNLWVSPYSTVYSVHCTVYTVLLWTCGWVWPGIICQECRPSVGELGESGTEDYSTGYTGYTVYTVYTVHTVYTVYYVYTVYTVYNVYTVYRFSNLINFRNYSLAVLHTFTKKPNFVLLLIYSKGAFQKNAAWLLISSIKGGGGSEAIQKLWGHYFIHQQFWNFG